MNKKYQTPEIQVASIYAAQIICTSLPERGKASDEDVTEADSRRHLTVWDDEEEDEENKDEFGY